ncbi:MAG: GNAT family protein [Candidatus Omnitrophota bacterium]
MLKGNKVYLAAIERGELKQLMNWRNNSDFCKHFREYRELNMDMQQRWYEEKVLNDPTTIMFGIHENLTKELIGCCGLVYVNWVYRHADISLYIGWKDSYIDDKGYAYESCRLLVDYGFDNLALNKIWTEIYLFDLKKKQLLENIGFKIDGILRENYFYDGKFHDSYIFSMLASERKDCFKTKNNK